MSKLDMSVECERLFKRTPYISMAEERFSGSFD
jgi:hypothetical protein